jgi:hypothetical protein
MTLDTMGCSPTIEGVLSSFLDEWSGERVSLCPFDLDLGPDASGGAAAHVLRRGQLSPRRYPVQGRSGGDGGVARSSGFHWALWSTLVFQIWLAEQWYDPPNCATLSGHDGLGPMTAGRRLEKVLLILPNPSLVEDAPSFAILSQNGLI